MNEVVPQLVGNTVEDVERELILGTLQRHSGNRTHAARVLGISVRTVRNKIRAYERLGFAIPAHLLECEMSAWVPQFPEINQQVVSGPVHPGASQ